MNLTSQAWRSAAILPLLIVMLMAPATPCHCTQPSAPPEAPPASPEASPEGPREAAPDRVIRLTVTLVSGQVVNGQVTVYDDIGFTLTDAQGTGHRLMWTSIPVDAFDRYWRFLEHPEDDGEALIQLGILLSRHRNGEQLASEAFDQALEADPDLAERIEQARQGQAPGEGPRYQGTADATMWGDLTPEVMEASNDSLREFCQRTQREMNLALNLYESPRFLICTDADERLIERCGDQLTRAYRFLSEMLNEDPDGNVFRGKCLIFIFDKRLDYIRFQRMMHETEAYGTGGLCHGFGNGYTHVALYRRPSARQTTHVLIHETTHAYLHRYRSPEHVPSWINEGLAEYTAHEIEPPGGASLYGRALLALEGQRGLGEGFFENEHLQRWQYDVAGALARYMSESGRPPYRRMIEAVKEGESWNAALDQSFHLEHRQLVQRFKRRLDRELTRQLQP